VTVIAKNTITRTSATDTDNQTVCINSAITAITYTTTGATDASVDDLPAGVTGSWSENTVTISGTPTSATDSPFTYTVTLTGGSETGTQTGTIRVTPANTISLSSMNTNKQLVPVNTAISPITYITTGATEVSFEGFPAGLTKSWEPTTNTVTISGTPTESGTFNYTVTLAGGCGTNVTATGKIITGSCPAKVDNDKWLHFQCHNLGGDDIYSSTPAIGSNHHGHWYRFGSTNVSMPSSAGSYDSWTDANYPSTGDWITSAPCPDGYRLPTREEWQQVINNNSGYNFGSGFTLSNINSGRRFGDYLVLPAAGCRNYVNGGLGQQGVGGYYWSSDRGSAMYLYTGNAKTDSYDAGYGYSVRCVVKEE
jgi:uncharacterized protein (TIGR02145 family)